MNVLSLGFIQKLFSILATSLIRITKILTRFINKSDKRDTGSDSEVLIALESNLKAPELPNKQL